MSKPRVFFVEGNIGTGKSTFLKMIENLNNDKYQVIYEPVDTWTSFTDSSGKNILQYFYDDPKRFAYTFQNTAFVSRVEKLKEIDETKEAVFIERSIWSDKHIFAKNCFESGTMSEIEYKLYLKWFTWLEENVGFKYMHEFVYLRCTPELSYERMKTRSRSEEAGVSLDYLTQIHEKHEDWVREMLQEGKTPITSLNAIENMKDESVFQDYLSFLLS
jgi:deoxyadenosine/deoxycytidine kinase